VRCSTCDWCRAGRCGRTCGYFALYLDRLNVSVAALTMNEDLGISPAVFGLIAGVFFWSYALLEVPSNYMVSRASASGSGSPASSSVGGW
jgi:sugar phosphate permease